MSSIFDTYDEEFLALTQDIGSNISHVNNYETDPGKNAFPMGVIWGHALSTMSPIL